VGFFGPGIGHEVGDGDFFDFTFFFDDDDDVNAGPETIFPDELLTDVAIGAGDGDNFCCRRKNLSSQEIFDAF
jgi:hypothetical protein